MALKSVLAVVQRAVLERSYRDLLFSNPASALSGYSLTRDEANSLKALNRDVFIRGLTDVEARIRAEGSLTEPLWDDFVAAHISMVCGDSTYPNPECPQPSGPTS